MLQELPRSYGKQGRQDLLGLSFHCCRVSAQGRRRGPPRLPPVTCDMVLRECTVSALWRAENGDGFMSVNGAFVLEKKSLSGMGRRKDSALDSMTLACLSSCSQVLCQFCDSSRIAPLSCPLGLVLLPKDKVGRNTTEWSAIDSRISNFICPSLHVFQTRRLVLEEPFADIR